MRVIITVFSHMSVVAEICADKFGGEDRKWQMVSEQPHAPSSKPLLNYSPYCCQIRGIETAKAACRLFLHVNMPHAQVLCQGGQVQQSEQLQNFLRIYAQYISPMPDPMLGELNKSTGGANQNEVQQHAPPADSRAVWVGKRSGRKLAAPTHGMLNHPIVRARVTNCPCPEFKQLRTPHLRTRDPFAADRTSAGLTALAMARHQRLGKESLAQRLPESAFEHIAGFVQSPAGMKAGGDGRTHNW